MAEVWRIAFSVERRRPGCVNVQAAMGGDVPGFAALFPAETWLVTTDGMRLYEVTPEQLTHLVAMAERAVSTT